MQNQRKDLRDETKGDKKKSVEAWKKNIGSLNDELKRTAKLLENQINDGDGDRGTVAGETTRNYFKNLFDRL
mgnify:CR=1 FL=1